MRIAIGFLLCFLTCHLLAQRKTYVLLEQRSTAIQSLHFKDTNYHDLEKLGSAIGESRIVLLGEQTHGDARAFEAKSRIVRYLHEKKGFNVLVFESDFYGLHESWNDCLLKDSSIEHLKRNVYSIWSSCSSVLSLFHYLDQNKRAKTLHVAGLDVRHVLRYAKEHYASRFKAQFQDRLAFQSDSIAFDYFLSILNELVKNEYKSHAKEGEKLFFEQYLNQLMALTGIENFWQQELKNLASFANNAWGLEKTELSRDAIMADNLLWLYRNKYQGEKLLVWAHNGHVSRDMASLRTSRGTYLFPEYTPNMGDLLYRELSDTLYSIGFVSNEGFSRFAGYDSISNFTAYKGSNYEQFMADKGFDLAFTDLRSLPEKRKFTLRGFNHRFPIKKEWKKTYDGLVFIREMKGCEE